MRRCEDEKMRRCEDEKMFCRAPLLEEPCAQTLSGKKIKTWKNVFFAGFREGPIQRYPSLSQTLEKLQNLEKIIFYWFAGGPKLGKIAKPGKMHVLLVSGKAPSNAIRPYPRP